MMDEIIDKPSRVYQFKKLPYGIRTGNSLKLKRFKYFHKRHQERVFKWVFYDKYTKKEAENILNDCDKVLADGLHSFAQKKVARYGPISSPLAYSLNKRKRWNLPYHIQNIAKKDSLSEETYKVCYLERFSNVATLPGYYGCGCTLDQIASVRTFYNENGEIKRPGKKYGFELDMINGSNNRPKLQDFVLRQIDNEESYFQVIYDICKIRPMDSLAKGNFGFYPMAYYDKKMNAQKHKTPAGKRFDKCLDSNYYLRRYIDEGIIHFNSLSNKMETEEEEETNTIHHSSNIVLGDFITKKNIRKRKQKLSKKRSYVNFKEESKSKIIYLDQNNINTNSISSISDFDIKEHTEEIEESTKLINTEAIFEFYLPLKSYKSFLLVCSQNNIPVLDAESSPPYFLLDFSKIVENICASTRHYTNKIKLIRALGLMTPYSENDKAVISMTFYSNIESSRALKSLKTDAKNVNDMIKMINHHVSGWLNSSRDFIRIIDLTGSKRDGNIRDKPHKTRIISGWILNNFGFSQTSAEKFDIFLSYLKSYWNNKKPDISNFSGELEKKNDWQITCKICMIEKDTHSGLAMKCGHWFCFACWKNYLLYNRSRNLNCPTSKCQQQIEHPIWLAATTLKIFQHIERLTVRKLIEQEKVWIHCSNSACNLLTNVNNSIKIPIVECSCSNQWCTECLDVFHWPATCNQIRYFNEVIDDSGIEKDRFMNEYYITEIRICPHCKEKVERESIMCNEMQCICGGRFCWNCLKKLYEWETHDSNDCSNENREIFTFIDDGFLKTDKFEFLQTVYKSFNDFNTLDVYPQSRSTFNGWKRTIERQLPTGKANIRKEIENEFLSILQDCHYLCHISDYIVMNTLVLIYFSGNEIAWKMVSIEFLEKRLILEKLLLRSILATKRLREKLNGTNFSLPENWIAQITSLKNQLERSLINIINNKSIPYIRCMASKITLDRNIWSILPT
ncbi:unnamed protein product [Dimorphilus gyrociliatus]|uniref:RBR-type E3 ubiquitin transferase n=1 Tax=Dimorphilus gyrociliatus TaxID=2664684 RepID=A0A7I8W508_9ANNE|nr:unnamed protein product [Dimorphilus gyrociliatus]